jgi:hypothetical protein
LENHFSTPFTGVGVGFWIGGSSMLTFINATRLMRAKIAVRVLSPFFPVTTPTRISLANPIHFNAMQFTLTLKPHYRANTIAYKH